MLTRAQILISLVVVLCCGVSVRAAQFDLEVYASRFDSIPIAVLPFTAANQTPLAHDKPWEVIADDLEFSYRFKVFRPAKVDSAQFAANEIGMYIHGEYSVKGDNVILDCYLRNAATSELLIGKKYQGELKFLRNMAHRFGNHIVEVIFGERGIFESRILFVRDKGDTKDIVVMDYDGHTAKVLTGSNSVNVFPAFIDQNNIVWTSFLRGKPDLYRGSIATGKSGIFLYSRFVDTSPDVSAVEGKVVFASSRSGDLEIYTAPLDNSQVKRLTFNRNIDTSPCWSPNGYQIAFTSDRSGQPQIYVMDADGANVRRITYEGNYQDSPAWSPKGDLIAYASSEKGKFDIWTVRPDGTEARKVTSVAGNNTYPAWSADGRHIVFSQESGGRSDLCFVRPDGTGFKKLTSNATSRQPAWSPF